MSRFIFSFIAFVTAWAAAASAAAEANFLTELARGKSQRVVVYGTSLTANAAWPQMLQTTLRQAYPGKLKVINSARGGMDSRWGIANFQERVLRQRPDTVFLEFAINDALAKSRLSVSESMAHLESMILWLREDSPYCDVVVMIMNPPTGSQFQERSRIREYEDGYRAVARRNQCRLVDFSSVWKSIITRRPALWRSYAPDGIHPNEEASREVILPYLLKKIGHPVALQP